MEKLHTLDARVGIYSAANDSTSQMTGTIADVLHNIRTGGKQRDQILTLRQEYQRLATIEDDKLRKAEKDSVNERLKKTLIGYTFNGTFSYRDRDNFIEPSGYTVIDFDGAKDVQKLKDTVFADDFCFACFISPSGTGVKAVYKIVHDNNPESLKRRISSLFERLRYNSKIDIANKEFILDKAIDISRLCFTSYDPHIYVNENSWVWEQIEEKPKESLTDWTTFKTPENIDRDEVTEWLKNWITQKFPDNMKEGSRFNTMTNLSPKILSWIMGHGLDIQEIQDKFIERYGAQFDNWEKPTEIQNLKNFWNKLIKGRGITPSLIDEFNDNLVLRAKSSNDNFIEADIKKTEVTVDSLDYGIFTSQKFRAIPPIEERLLLTLNVDESKCEYLEIGAISSVVAAPSAGKTSLVNSIIAQCFVDEHKRDSVNKFHFKIEPIVKRILVFDSEIGFNGYGRFYTQIAKRIYWEKGKDRDLQPHITDRILEDLIDNNKVTYFSWSNYTIKAKCKDPMVPMRQLIKRAWDEGYKYDMIIIDDFTVFTPDVNHGEKAFDVVMELIQLSMEYQFGVFATIHTNPGDEGGKARGHSGGELGRKSQSLLHLERDNKTALFNIKTGVGNKNRNGALTFLLYDRSLSGYWDNDFGCVIGCDSDEAKGRQLEVQLNKKSKPELIFDFVYEKCIEAFKQGKTLKNKEVKGFISQWYKNNKEKVPEVSTIKQHYKEFKDAVESDRNFIISGNQHTGWTFDGFEIDYSQTNFEGNDEPPKSIIDYGDEMKEVDSKFDFN